MNAGSKTGLLATEYKNIDGLKIRFATNGRKDGDPILLLSPLPESILAFLPTWEMFSALGPVIAVDLPPFGLSESRAGGRTPEAAGEFVLRIMESFGIEHPHVIAPDIGTPACLFAAANHPGVFKSLVIGSGATDHTDTPRRNSPRGQVCIGTMWAEWSGANAMWLWKTSSSWLRHCRFGRRISLNLSPELSMSAPTYKLVLQMVQMPGTTEQPSDFRIDEDIPE